MVKMTVQSKKGKTTFFCKECGHDSTKWLGVCPNCKAWNTFIEENFTKANKSRAGGYSGIASEVISISDIEITEDTKISVSCQEFDRVLGGGLVMGAVVLVGGDPGIGKSTLLLQTLTKLSFSKNVLYVTGEESLQQVKVRAERLGLTYSPNMKLFAATDVESIGNAIDKEKPEIVVIDSVQTLYLEQISSAPGSVSQVRESAAYLVKIAKKQNISFFIVGHVTKEGSIAGPRVLEHMVDTVLYFEGSNDSKFRILRSVKNRFGAVNELGLFAMTERGLKAVSNPSAIFLSAFDSNISGNAITVIWEGSRPILIEIQALVSESYSNHPRRVAVGIDVNRLSLLTAILHKNADLATYNYDIFINVVGGVKILETSSDLALIMALISSIKNKPIPRDTIIIGEVGLGGEIRPVQYGLERLKEASKHGFKKAVIPESNLPKGLKLDMEILPVKHINQVELL